MATCVSLYQNMTELRQNWVVRLGCIHGSQVETRGKVPYYLSCKKHYLKSAALLLQLPTKWVV